MKYFIVYTLNLIDLFCTLHALKIGVKEANPLMQSVPVMVFYKTVIVGGLLLWLSRQKSHFAKVGNLACGVVYGVLDLYHIAGLTAIL